MEVVTLKTVAERASVGRSTATHVLAGRGDELGIRPETQQRVREAAKRLRYRPNYLARGLAGRSTQSVGVVWTFPGFHPHQMMRRELTMRLHERGYQPLVADSFSDRERVREDLREFRRRGVDGLIVRPSVGLGDDSEIAAAIDHWPRKVVVADELETSLTEPNWPGVVRDVLPAMRELARHLASSGRRRPGMIISSMSGNRAKVETFSQALREEGLEIGEDQLISLDQFHERHQEDHCELFAQALPKAQTDLRRFDALLFSSDEGAGVVLQMCRRQGIGVPEDLALIGFNDAPFCKITDPPLASVSWENSRTAELIMELMWRQLEGEDLSGVRRRIPMSFCWRPSAG